MHARGGMGWISWWCVRGGGAPEPPSPICIVLDVVSFPNFSYTHFVYRPRESSRSTQASIEVGALQSKLAACDLHKASTWLATCTKRKVLSFFCICLCWNHLESVSSPKQHNRSTSEAHRKRSTLVEPMSH